MRSGLVAGSLLLALLPGCARPAAEEATSPVAGSTSTARAAAGTGRGPAMVRIPAGSFLMGSNDGEPDEQPVHGETVAAFELDVTEVTVGQYRSCVSGGGCTAPGTGGYCNWDQPRKDAHPVNCVDWEQATAFCAWAGKRLPTEPEWEYAARGTDGRTYPWGNAAAAGQLCWRRSDGTCAVGSRHGQSPFGALDLVGSVWEWTSAQYCESYSPEAKCGEYRVLRGGCWYHLGAAGVRAAARISGGPAVRSDFVGFRCARP